MGIEPKRRTSGRGQATQRPDCRVAIAAEHQRETASVPGLADGCSQATAEFEGSANFGRGLAGIILNDLRLGNPMAMSLKVRGQAGLEEMFGTFARAPTAARRVVGYKYELDVHISAF